MKFIKEVLEQSNTKLEFEKRLRSVNIQMDYAKDGTVRGVISGDKRYSWKRLGISKEDLIKIQHREQVMHLEDRISRLEKMQQIRQKRKDIDNNMEID